MYSRSEVLAIVLIVEAWNAAFLLFGLLVYARTRFGVGKSRSIGAILIDIGMTFALLVVMLGIFPFVRILGGLEGEPWITIVRFGNILAYLLVIVFAVVRLLVFFLIGDGPVRWPWDRHTEDA